MRRILSHDGKEFLTGARTHTGVRSIHLPEQSVEALKKQKNVIRQEKLSAGQLYKDNNLGVCTTIGTPINQSNIPRTWYQLLFHDLRHTYATLLGKQGENLKVVSERLGHADVRTTLNICSQVLPSMQKESAETRANAIRRSMIVNSSVRNTLA